MTHKQTLQNTRWWGWGSLNHSYDEKHATMFVRVAAARFGFTDLPPETLSRRLNEVLIPPSQLARDFIERWQSKGLSLDQGDRLIHAAGRSYADLIRLRTGTLERYPDGVLFLERAEDLPQLFTDAKHHGITLVPFGGGTSVVGGTECVGPKNRPILIIDLKGLSRLIALDAQSLTATFEAGILGPDLEAILNEQGYTLGHFPQSFEYSTLGGWVVTRSAGQNSTQYGKIEKNVVALKAYSPSGILETKPFPASAAGPSLNDIIAGSEGLYGIVTEVTVRIHRRPDTERFVSAMFRDFSQGVACVRSLMQQGRKLSVIRLSDAPETSLLLRIKLPEAWKQNLLKKWLSFKKLGDSPCLFLVSTEGNSRDVAREHRAIQRVIDAHGGVRLPKNLGPTWKRDRFKLPYLRDNLLDRGFFLDTLETATEWSKLDALYLAMTEAFRVRDRETQDAMILGCHVSHAYRDGASLYFTIIGRRQNGHEIAQWKDIKTLASNIIAQHGGTISHHHGVGTDHRAWMQHEKSELGIATLRNLKTTFDPDQLLNPEKLFESS